MKTPEWIKIKPYDKIKYKHTLEILEKGGLNTVCLAANCPNRYECFAGGTATFMILGGVCTRNCAYCNIKKGRPQALDPAEPDKIAAAVKKLGLKYAVITCVSRDDLDDGGAGQFARTIRAIKKNDPDCRVEVLISDLSGNWTALKKIIDAKPEVVNHNLEAVKEIFSAVRPKGDYNLSLELLQKAKELSSGLITKSGFMVGLGETDEQIRQTLADLKKSACDIVTVGQYLSPGPGHLEVKKYYKPGEFKKISKIALDLGISRVVASPLSRSSYHAHDIIEKKPA